MKTLIISMCLVGCGSGQFQIPQGDKKTAETPTNKPESAPKPSTTEGAAPTESSARTASTAVVVTPGAEPNPAGPIPALAFTGDQKISGVSRILSAVRAGSALYFIGEDLKGVGVLGQMSPSGGDAVLYPLGQLNDNNIVLKGKNFLIGATPGALYLGGYNEIIQVDLGTMKTVSRINSECSLAAPWTYLKDDRWNLIWNSTVSICGTVDGATIQKNKPIINKATGNSLRYDYTAMYANSGESIQEYSRSLKVLTEYSTEDGFAEKQKLSLSGYLYNGPESVLVPGDGRILWFFGCSAEKDCYLSTAEMSQQ